MAVVAGVAVVGVSAVLISRAAGPTASLEPENGTLGQNASLVTDATASNGSAVRFSAQATYYVATNGNDSANGNSSTPWRTIQKAINTVPTGATIRVRGGTYEPFSVTKSGVTIMPDTSSGVVIQGRSGVRDIILVQSSNVTISGLTVQGCVPNPTPGSFEDNGSTGIRINDGTTGVVVRNSIIRDSHGTNNYGLPFGCMAILVHNANSATIDNNEMYHNGYGVFVLGGGQNLAITNNRIHDNDVIIRNTPSPLNDDDFGGVAVGFMNVTASPGPTARDNTIYNNSGPSNDYTADGGAFEIFQASNLTIDHNTIYNNDNVVETGTGSSTNRCQNNVFTNNTASGKSAGSTLPQSAGLILRCADNMTISGNTITSVDWWTFMISRDSYSGSVSGLRITNNTISQNRYKIYELAFNPAGLGFVFSGNRYHQADTFATDWNNSYVTTLSAWQSRVGLDTTSTTF